MACGGSLGERVPSLVLMVDHDTAIFADITCEPTSSGLCEPCGAEDMVPALAATHVVMWLTLPCPPLRMRCTAARAGSGRKFNARSQQRRFSMVVATSPTSLIRAAPSRPANSLPLRGLRCAVLSQQMRGSCEAGERRSHRSHDGCDRAVDLQPHGRSLESGDAAKAFNHGNCSWRD